MANAYAELSTCRAVGMSLGPIPWTAVVAWCDRHGLDADLADHLAAVVAHVDQETLRREAARARAGSRGGGGEP